MNINKDIRTIDYKAPTHSITQLQLVHVGIYNDQLISYLLGQEGTSFPAILKILKKKGSFLDQSLVVQSSWLRFFMVWRSPIFNGISGMWAWWAWWWNSNPLGLENPSKASEDIFQKAYKAMPFCGWVLGVYPVSWGFYHTFQKTNIVSQMNSIAKKTGLKLHLWICFTIHEKLRLQKLSKKLTKNRQ